MSTEEQLTLIKELDSLRQEVTELRANRTALDIQTKLLENLVEIARSPSQEVLKSTLQTTLDIAANQTQSERGSLFILDREGKTVDAILARTDVTPELRERLIGIVLDKGLAGWVARDRKLGLVIDTEKDDRWVPLPNQPYITRSALSVPILRGEDLLGIITLQHSEPGHFTEEVARLMQITANQMSLVLENARLYSTLTLLNVALNQYNKIKTEELEKGQKFQLDFLPYELPKLPNWEIATCLHPAIELSGDFYDVLKIGNYMGLVIADVCDKGVSSALFMALIRSLIRIFAPQQTIKGKEVTKILQDYEPPGGWLGDSNQTNYWHINALNAVNLTHEYIIENHSRVNMFATLFFGILDPSTGLLSYINGGHESLYIVGEAGIKATLKRTGPAVGALSKESFKIHQVYLEPGDILFGYTDGVTDAKNPDGERFVSRKDKQRLLSLLEIPATSAAELLKRIKMNVFTYIDKAPQFDDITILAVRHELPLEK